MTDPDPPFPGLVVPGMRFGAYEVLCCVARGGMASVWAARQIGARGFSKLVALKTILPELAVLPEFEGLFLEEARLAAQIHHPNVCEIFELIEQDGILALSMEWVNGDALGGLLSIPEANPSLDPRISARIVAEAAAGLHAVHELRDDSGAPMNVVHRDVSAQNILISREGHVKIADFGIAKALGSLREATEDGHIRGKVSYMSPEQAQALSMDRRSDIFSLGVVLYLASLGRQPFRRPDERTNRTLTRLLTGDFAAPRSLDPAYPEGLERIVLRAMARQPARRYATAAEMRYELESWLAQSGAPVTESDVAAVLHSRRCQSIELKDARIRACLRASRVPMTPTFSSPAASLPERPPDGEWASSRTRAFHLLEQRIGGRLAPWLLAAGATVVVTLGAMALSDPQRARELSELDAVSELPGAGQGLSSATVVKVSPEAADGIASSPSAFPPAVQSGAADGPTVPTALLPAGTPALRRFARPKRPALSTPRSVRPSFAVGLKKSGNPARAIGPLEHDL